MHTQVFTTDTRQKMVRTINTASKIAPAIWPDDSQMTDLANDWVVLARNIQVQGDDIILTGRELALIDGAYTLVEQAMETGVNNAPNDEDLLIEAIIFLVHAQEIWKWLDTCHAPPTSTPIDSNDAN